MLKVPGCNPFGPLACVALLTAQLAATRAAEPSVDPKDLPRVPPVEPAQALGTFQVKPGFHLDLVAAEPLVVDPIAMCFDENGHLFVVEMRDYSERRDERLGRIRLLIDTDGDGHFNKSTIFAENLPWPTALFYYNGGLFVGSTPDIWYFKDTNGDGVADEKKLVFTGFAQGPNDSSYGGGRLNVQGLFNSFNWTLDNRIHGASGTMGGLVYPADSTNNTINVRGKDFSFDPRNLTDLRTETGGGQHGLSFDDTGRKFVCHNSSHIRLAMYEDRYAARNPYYAMPPGLLDIPVDGPAAEVYRISPEEPWRVIRTKWRVSGQVSGPIEGGGRASGYFTSATGITIYRGNAFPEDLHGDAFIADVGSNLIHRKKLYPDGVALTAKRPPDEQKVEFIASKDLWFRPVQFANAPDGTLYVADMYREVVEHPWSIPESIKKHLDLNSGNDRGRIYRIVPDNFKQPKLPQLGKASTAELVATLAHPNGWHRDTAGRLLYERQDRAAIPLLKKLATESKSSLGRMHALYALDGFHGLAIEDLLSRLSDNDEVVREHAVRLSERVVSRDPDSQLAASLRAKLPSLARDPSLRVRYQLAFTLGEMAIPAKTAALAEIVRRDSAGTWTRAAVLSSLASGAGALFEELTGNSASSALDSFLRELLSVIGTSNKPADVDLAIQALEKETNSRRQLNLAEPLAAGLERSGKRLSGLANFLEPLTRRALVAAQQKGVSADERLQAILFLQHTTFAQAGKALLSLITAAEPQSVQLAALKSLARLSDPNLAAALIEQWPTFTPKLRNEILDALIVRADRATTLLKAISSQKIRLSELTPAQIRSLRNHSDTRVRELAAQTLGFQDKTSRDQVVAAFRPALDLQGDAVRGKPIYLERCASCHRAGTDGQSVGPDFNSVKNSGKEKLLINILDPNRDVPPQYIAYTVETKDGESMTGIISTETSANVSLLQASGKPVSILRSQIKQLQSQRQSLMPEGLEVGLSPQQMADLLAFIEAPQAL